MISTPVQNVPFERQAILPFPGLFEANGDDGLLLLRDFYTRDLLPRLQHLSKSHREKFSTVLAAWEQRTENLPLFRLDANDAELERFLHRLRHPNPGETQLSPSAANGYLGYVLQILNLAGPRDRFNRSGKGIIRTVPWAQSLPVTRRFPRTASLLEIGQFYAAASIATWPQNSRLPAPLWWRELIVLALSYGPRTADLSPIKIKGSGLRSQQIFRDGACPFPEIELENPAGWLVFQPSKTKAEKPELILPLTSVVRRHVDALPRSRSPESLLLPCITHYDDFLKQRRKIEAEAQLKRPLTIQVLRRSATSRWQILHEGVGNYITGHAARGVNAQNYLDCLVPLLEDASPDPRMIDRFQYPQIITDGPP